MEIPVLYQDEHLLVCEKPVGIRSENDGLPQMLKTQCGGEAYCVHRLDQAVGGLMVYARTPADAAKLSKAIAERQVRKEYLAVVTGRPEEPKGELRDLLYHDVHRNKSYVVQRPRRGVKEAVLQYEVLQSRETEAGRITLLLISLMTGRAHQIRVQFASRGMPLLGDRRYGSKICADGAPTLWSYRLGFAHPKTEKAMSFLLAPPDRYPWDLFTEYLNDKSELPQS